MEEKQFAQENVMLTRTLSLICFLEGIMGVLGSIVVYFIQYDIKSVLIVSYPQILPQI